MAITVKNNKISEEIVDKNGKVLGKIEYDPSDTKVYNELLNIINETLEIKNKITEVPNIDDKSINTIEDLEKNRDIFNKILEVSNYSSDKIKNITEGLDSIFGVGVCDIFLQGTQNLNYLEPLINGVLPNFKEARQGKIDKYLSDESDVMS